MSRCFPFPPPGYEKKARIDDTDLLAKEKNKEKKHKKEKDKEKREGKEKKDKDRNKEKHREKKDRKEKHKERDRDKEKNRSSDAKRIEVQTGPNNGEKLDPYGFRSNEIKDSKHVQELARRIRDEDGASGSQMVQNISASDERRVQGLARKIRDADGASGSQMVWNTAPSDERRVKQQGMAAEMVVDKKPEKETVKDKKEDHRKSNGQENHVGARGMEKPSVQIPSCMDQERGEPIAKPLGKEDADKQMEGKEKIKHKEREGKGDKHKHKDRDRGKDKKSKDRDLDKEKKTEEKAKENKQSSKEQPKSKGSDPKSKENTKDSLDFRNTKPSDSPKLINTSLVGDGNLGKRKEPERNGYLIDDGNRPNKSARPLSCPQPITEIGKKLELSQTTIQFGQQGPTNNHGAQTKDVKINGFITPQQPNESSTKPSMVHVTKNENGEASVKVKSPHPDAEYLSQILSVPVMGDLPGSLDQEWLFGSNHLPPRKLNTGSPAVDRTQQVWSQAVQIESADILALPYVIPY